MNSESRTGSGANPVRAFEACTKHVVLFILLLLAAACSAPPEEENSEPPEPETRAVGPRVDATDFPWQVGLEAEGIDGHCGAVQISQNFVLTAAHCLDKNLNYGSGAADLVDATKVTLFAATNKFGDEHLEVATDWPIRAHPCYKLDRRGPGPHSVQIGASIFNCGSLKIANHAAYDSAIIRLAESRDHDVTTAPVRAMNFDDGNAVMSGWGLTFGEDPKTMTKELRAATVPIKSVEQCRFNLAGFTNVVGDHAICSLDEVFTACGYDSGGPLVAGSRAAPQTVGIVSGGSSLECGVPRPNTALVTVYTRASALKDWVLHVTRDPTTVTSDPLPDLMQVRSID